MEEIIEEEKVAKDPFGLAEELIARGELDEAQSILNKINEKSGRKFFVLSKLYKARKWYNEQRKVLQAAVELEPDNEKYKKELAEIEEFSKTKEYKKAVKKQQMGSFKSRVKEGCNIYSVCNGCCAGC